MSNFSSRKRTTAGAMHSLLIHAVALCAVGLLASHASVADVHPASVFGDHMVLQRDIPIPVWGTADPGERVTVTVGADTQAATATPDGAWSVRLKRRPASATPLDVTIAGKNTIAFHDVLVGDVWICSGQSNMEFGIGNANNAQDEIAKADNPQIRLLAVAHNVAASPITSITGSWTVCSPQTVAVGGWSGFSAVGYFFGSKIQKDENVPVGLIGTYWGGTPAQSWTSLESLGKLPDFKDAVKNFIPTFVGLPGEKSKDELRAEWQVRNDLNSASVKAILDPSYDVTSWKTMKAPRYWDASDLGQMVGTVWFRKDFDLPDSLAGKDAELFVAKVDDADDTFVNGVRVGGFNNASAARAYPVAAKLLKAGRNTILVRVLNTGGPGGIWGSDDQLKLVVASDPGDPATAPISLAGDWKYGVVDPMPAVVDAWTISALYNGMIAPLEPYGVKGAIWYQGESNAGQSTQYATLFPAMITDWRKHWGEGDFPFFFVQLANFMGRAAAPTDGGWAALREAQRETLSLPNTGMAVAIDIGNGQDIHPKDKWDVGNRLALAAEHVAYGAKIVYSGPMYKSMKVEGSKVRLSFDSVGGGLIIGKQPEHYIPTGDEPFSATQLQGFTIAGSDNKFAWADAVIDGDSVVVSSASVPSPVSVRYGWADNPAANLYNKEGLPASPFRTDSLPMGEFAVH